MFKIYKHIVYCLTFLTLLGCKQVTSTDDNQENSETILFYSQKNLFTMDENGENIKHLTNNDFHEVQAVYSPDKKRIAFSSDRNSAAGDSYSIYLMNNNGKSIKKLTDDTSTDIFPNWSPDSREIVYSRETEDNLNIFKIDTSGNNSIRLTDLENPNSAYHPAWSPDGTKIAYSKYDGSIQNIFIMDPDGSNKYQLTSDSTGNHNYQVPKWITNDEISVLDPNNGDKQIIKIDINTGKKTVVLDSIGGTYASADNAWSNDLNKIAHTKYIFDSDTDEADDEILIYDLKKGTEERITDNNHGDIILDWQ